METSLQPVLLIFSYFFVRCRDGNIKNNDNYKLFKRIKQPNEDCTVFNQCVIRFLAPEQDEDVIEEIDRIGLQLRISAFRPSDRRMSLKHFKFTYVIE